MLCTFWADTTSLFEPGSYHKPIPLFPQARPECIDYQLHVMPRPLKPSARGLLSQTSSEHHVELYLKPDSTRESGYTLIGFMRYYFCGFVQSRDCVQMPSIQRSRI